MSRKRRGRDGDAWQRSSNGDDRVGECEGGDLGVSMEARQPPSDRRTQGSRGELRDGPNDDHRVSAVIFLRIKVQLVYCFVGVPSKTSKGFHWFLFGEWTSI